MFDPALKFDKRINSVVKSAFLFQLRMIAKIKYFLSFKDLETVIRAFISTRLDYCNSLYLGITQSCLSPKQPASTSERSSIYCVTSARSEVQVIYIIYTNYYIQWLLQYS